MVNSVSCKCEGANDDGEIVDVRITEKPFTAGTYVNCPKLQEKSKARAKWSPHQSNPDPTPIEICTNVQKDAGEVLCNIRLRAESPVRLAKREL